MNFHRLVSNSSKLPHFTPKAITIEAFSNGRWAVRDFLGELLGSGKARRASVTAAKAEARAWKKANLTQPTKPKQ